MSLATKTRHRVHAGQMMEIVKVGIYILFRFINQRQPSRTCMAWWQWTTDTCIYTCRLQLVIDDLVYIFICHNSTAIKIWLVFFFSLLLTFSTGWGGVSCSDLSWFRQCRNSTKSYKDYVYKVSHSFRQLAKVTYISLLLYNTPSLRLLV